MACLPQLGIVPAVYAVVAGGCDWPLPPAVGLANNDVIELRALRSLRCVRCVGWKPRFTACDRHARLHELNTTPTACSMKSFYHRPSA